MRWSSTGVRRSVPCRRRRRRRPRRRWPAGRGAGTRGSSRSARIGTAGRRRIRGSRPAAPCDGDLRFAPSAGTGSSDEFDGIPLAALDFYEALEADNSKTFWAAHKHLYESVKAPMLELTAELGPEFGVQAVSALSRRPVLRGQDPVQDPPGRLVRRVRAVPAGFGRWPVHRWRLLAVRPEEVADSAGQWMTSARGGAGEGRGGGGRAGLDIGGEPLTRVPRFTKDHPRADLLRHKTLTAGRDLAARLAGDAVRGADRRPGGIEPLVAWLRPSTAHSGRAEPRRPP